jgi:LysR family hydrogen peroxide-inducible transcriptional activator
MANLTLKQLRYFEALARDGHFRRCVTSQPALSIQIKEREQELGSELFECSVREVKLTAFGQRTDRNTHSV